MGLGVGGRVDCNLVTGHACAFRVHAVLARIWVLAQILELVLQPCAG